MRVVLCLAALLALLGCEKQTGTGIRLDHSIAKLVPPDTTVLAGIDVDRLRATDFYRRHQDLIPPGELKVRTRDLNRAFVAWDGKQPLAILKGHFSDSDAKALTVLPDGTALFGPDAAKRSRGGSSELPNEFETGLRWLPKTDHVWEVSRGTLPFADVPMRSDYASLLSNFAGYIEATAIGLEVDSGLHVRARISCVSPEGGKRVNDALRGGIGLARLSTKDDQMQILKVYDAIHVRQENETVYVEANLAAAEADQLIRLVSPR